MKIMHIADSASAGHILRTQHVTLISSPPRGLACGVSGGTSYGDGPDWQRHLVGSV